MQPQDHHAPAEPGEPAERDVEQRLRLAIQSARIGTWDFDVASGVLRLDVRCKQLFGLGPEDDPTYLEFLAQLHPDDRAATDRAKDRALAGVNGGRYEMEHRAITPEGAIERWVACHGQVLFDEVTGAPQRFIGITLDITEQRRAAADRERLLGELTTAVRARDDLISIAGHELRTPLSALQLHIEGMQHRLAVSASEPTKLAARLGKAMGLVSRLERLIGELLEVSRLHSGQDLTIRPERMDLLEVVEEVVERFGPALSRAGCAVSLARHPGVIGSWDRFRLDQVLSNLIENAIKYGRGSPIELVVESRENHAVVSIRDHGIGIAMADQARIFERFERAVSTRHYGGFGLGLWIARQIVEAHHGRIRVSSAPGTGTTFSVELPL